jgi:hypothetical protein
MDEHDRAARALLEALRQALASSTEQRLYKSGKLDGLFSSKAGAPGAAADQALRAGLLEVVRREVRGKAEIDWVRVTPRGVEFLHQHESPVHALHELRDALRASQEALPAWLAGLRAGLRALDERLAADAAHWNERLAALERRVEDSLRRVEAAAPLVPPEVVEDHPWAIDALNYLDRRQAAGSAGDCPLHELFTAVREHHPEISLPAFHDGLRRLHERRAVLLRPADGTAEHSEYILLHGGRMLYYAAR